VASTPADVTSALAQSNRNVGGGFLQHGDQQLAIRGVGYIRTPHDVQATVLKNEGGTPVTVADVSRVVLSHTPRLGAVGYNTEGETAEGFALLRRGEVKFEGDQRVLWAYLLYLKLMLAALRR